ncbi:EAL domain-containing protein [Vibrio algarum]|uniref:EAL domain-containing protein n=1 Tax=Vibrio algarum TaxID=3020714 RepID=A0ABT4YSE4_9VIBR|nr:EAL domain-containing protein [Vibrio sp. KJ40-1]MDB1124443.1 EAL domain-containing protein [Vibrio sp. KJ40-1]
MNLFDPKDVQHHLEIIDGEWVGHYGDYILKSVFQPIWNKSLSEIYGYEGLTRVSKGTKSIDPTHFFTLFADATEITNVGIICASIHVRNYSNAYLKKKLFINVHPTMFAQISGDQYSISKVFERLASVGIDCNQMVWEITEFEENDTKKLLSGLSDFKEFGNQIAVDDFGNKESNHKRVNLLNPDIVKIDRALVREYCQGVNSTYLPQLLNKLHQNGRQTVLEGIETELEYSMLESLSFDFIQGYYSGRPYRLRRETK